MKNPKLITRYIQTKLNIMTLNFAKSIYWLVKIIQVYHISITTFHDIRHRIWWHKQISFHSKFSHIVENKPSSFLLEQNGGSRAISTRNNEMRNQDKKTEVKYLGCPFKSNLSGFRPCPCTWIIANKRNTKFQFII